MKRPFDSDNKNSDSVSSNVSTWLACLSYSLPLSQRTLSFLPQFEIKQQTYSLRRRLHSRQQASEATPRLCWRVIASLLWWGDAIFDGKAPNVKWKIEKRTDIQYHLRENISYRNFGKM
jgi:hypothetical protein